MSVESTQIQAVSSDVGTSTYLPSSGGQTAAPADAGGQIDTVA